MINFFEHKDIPFGKGKLGCFLFLLVLFVGFSSACAQEKDQINTGKRIELQFFSLSKVHLLDSPFRHAMELDGDYLLKLDPDRLLAPYLKAAELHPKAKNYGGWESNGVVGEGLDGHTLGHYLSALSMIYASTGNQRYNDRIKYIVSELSRCQKAIGTGYVGGVPNGRKVFHEMENGEIDAKPFSLNGAWVPWYNLHKLFAGLRDAYRHAENKQALQVLIKLSDWAVDFSQHLTDEQFQKMLQTEQGGMKEVMADVYAITGNEEYLELSKRFTHHAVFDPLEKGEDDLAGLHANTQIPKIVGAARDYEVSGDKQMQQVAEFFWQTVVMSRTYANGGNSDQEHFGKIGNLSKRIDRATTETCNTYNMLKLTRHLTQWNAKPAYADYYERALYNHILASQDPKTGMFAYFMSMEPGFFKTFSKPYDSFWCCVGTGMENHTKYGRYIYMHNDDGLYVNLFIPSVLNWKEKGLKVRQETSFPESDHTSFNIETDHPQKIDFKIRRPSWAGEGFSIKVNGKFEAIDKGPGSYISVEHTWNNGDKIEVTLPMRLRAEAMPNDDSKVAFMYGPILLAGIVGTDVPMPVQYASDQTAFFDLPSVHVPALDPQKNAVENWAAPAEGKPLHFKLQNVGQYADGITLAPFYEVNHNYYTVYWDIRKKPTVE